MGYTTDLAFTDAFFRDVLTAAQANPDPSSWSPITSGPPSAQDAMLLAADGLQRLHFDENGAVTGGGLSQEPSPSGALTSGTASPPVLTLDTGAGAGAVPALPLETGTGAAPGIPVGGLLSGGGSPAPPSGGAPGGVSGLHIDDQGDATPSPLEGFGSPIDLGIPGANISDHGASGSGWLLDI
jgi:hypothetical protein